MTNDDDTQPHQLTGSSPFYAQLHICSPPFMSIAEACALYACYLKDLPGYPWTVQHDLDASTLPLSAPCLVGADAETLSIEQLMAGIYIDIPRSSRIRTGDKLWVRWGRNTFYSTLAKTQQRGGPRLRHPMSCEKLPEYESGTVEVRYEVFRQMRLVGASEPLSVTLQAEGLNHYKRRGRIHTRRRRKPQK